jgi:hypothetical protein
MFGPLSCLATFLVSSIVAWYTMLRGLIGLQSHKCVSHFLLKGQGVDDIVPVFYQRMRPTTGMSLVSGPDGWALQ